MVFQLEPLLRGTWRNDQKRFVLLGVYLATVTVKAFIWLTGDKRQKVTRVMTDSAG